MTMNTYNSDFDNTSYQPGQVWEIDHGYDVFAADGEKVGDVQDVQPHYLTVSKGFFFPSERHVPVDAIADVREERVYLAVNKNQLDSQNWETVPAAPTYTETDTDTLVGERTTTTETDDDVRIPLMEEQLQVGKHEVRRGLVRVHKRVESEQQSVNVPLREETVHVERHAVSGDYTDNVPADAFQETEIDIELRGEEADVSKRAVVREEVEIDKDVVERNQQVTDTVRREDVHVHDSDTTVGMSDRNDVTDTTRGSRNSRRR